MKHDIGIGHFVQHGLCQDVVFHQNGEHLTNLWCSSKQLGEKSVNEGRHMKATTMHDDQ